VGVEFTADGHYYPLVRNDVDDIVRLGGIDYDKKWEYLPRGSATPIGTSSDARILLNGVLTDAPTLTEDPVQLRILFTPVPSRYVPLDP